MHWLSLIAIFGLINLVQLFFAFGFIIAGDGGDSNTYHAGGQLVTGLVANAVVFILLLVNLRRLSRKFIGYTLLGIFGWHALGAGIMVGIEGTMNGDCCTNPTFRTAIWVASLAWNFGGLWVGLPVFILRKTRIDP